MYYQKFSEIVFTLQLASVTVTSIGLVLVLFLFLDRVRERDTTVFLPHILAFTHLREETYQTVCFNMIIALPFYFFSLPSSNFL